MNVVLLIDDDDDVRTATEEDLRLAGFDVIAASSGAEGYAAIAGRTPAAIVLDYDMPLIDGRLTAEAFRLDPALCDVPVVGVSGHHDATSMRASPNVVAVLRKPFELDALLETLKLAMGRAARRTIEAGARSREDSSSAGGRSRI